MEDKRKNDILDAATEIIAKYGYTQAKIFEISKKAHVASGLIYSPEFFKNYIKLATEFGLTPYSYSRIVLNKITNDFDGADLLT